MWNAILATAVIAQLGCTGPRADEPPPDIDAEAPAEAQPVATTPGPAMAPAQRTGIVGDAEVLGALNARDANIIEAATLAQEKAQDSDVRAFADELLTSHGESLTRGNELAKALDLSRELPPDSTMARRQRAVMDRLSLAQGDAVDRAFVEFVHQSLDEELQKLEGEYLGATRHAQVKAFVTERAAPMRAERDKAAAWLAGHRQ